MYCSQENKCAQKSSYKGRFVWGNQIDKTANDVLEEEIQNSDATIAILENKEKKYLETIKTLEKRDLEMKKPSQSSVAVESQTYTGN